MPRSQRCAACKAPVPPAAAFCPGCGRFVADDEKALELEIMAPVREQPPGDAVVRVGAGEQTRRQLMVIGAVLLLVIVIAVFLGKGRSKSATPPRTTSTSAAVTSSLPESTTSVAPTTAVVDTTAVPPPTTIASFPPLTAKPATVFAATQSGDIVRIDLAAGTMTPLTLVSRGDAPIDAVFAVQGGVFFRQGQGVGFLSTAGDSSVNRLSVSPYIVGTPDGVGLLVDDTNGSVQQLDYVGPDLVVHQSIPIPTGFPAGFVTGGVIVQTNGLGAYRFDLTTGAATRVLAGSYLASRGDEVVGIVCDTALKCELDTTVGGRLKYHVPLPTRLSLNQSSGAAVSPDGKLLAYVATGGGQGNVVGVVNLANGQVSIAVADVNSQALVWTPGGEGVVWVMSGSVVMWSGRQGEAVVAVPSVSEATDISVR